MVHPYQLFHLHLSIEVIRQLHDLQQLLDQVHFHLLRINGDILGLEYFFH
jgi:predicted transcriptional regulator